MARLNLRLDERVEDMTDEAVTCRTLGHNESPRPPGSKRRAELRREGYVEAILVCGTCGRTRTLLIDGGSWDVLSSSTKYPDGYLVKNGQGRLPRSAARKAMFVRHDWV